MTSFFEDTAVNVIVNQKYSLKINKKGTVENEKIKMNVNNLYNTWECGVYLVLSP